ncbi:MAG: radical SAM protein, partial [Candidatus Bathyarchaeia archaeon]
PMPLWVNWLPTPFYPSSPYQQPDRCSQMGVPLTPLRLGLILTYRCNASCRHCYFNAGPSKTEEMSKREALNYLDQAAEFSTLRMVSLTGGEPFLLPELLREALSHASDMGLKTEVVTNCFWAENEEGTREQLGSLADAGLDVINISADDFHQEFIPFNYVRNCYEAAKELGLKITILCSVSKSSRLRVEKIVDLLGDANIQILGGGTLAPDITKAYAMAVETAFIPAGRGSQIPRGEWIIGHSPAIGPCPHVLRDIAIEPSGGVLPCCSAAGHIGSLNLGNAKREPLSRIIKRANRREVFNVLARRGPQGLLDITEGDIQGNYVNECHLCYESLLGLERRGHLQTPRLLER